MTQAEADALRWDHAVAAAALVLEMFDSSPEASEVALVRQAAIIVLEAMNKYETEAGNHDRRISLN
jgi:hypothetical protein